MTESFYDLLGIEADADEDEIRRAYRERLKQTHPDVSDDPDADARTQRLVEAKETLLDSGERARYDRLGHEAYVGEETGDGNDDGGSGASEAVNNSEAAAHRATAGAEGGSGPTNATADPWERRAREEWAKERVESDSWWAEDGTEDFDTPSAGSTSAESTRSGGLQWESRFDVSVEPGSVRNRDPWLSIGESPATTLTAFVLYPVLLGGAVFPAFPLWANAIVAACTVAMIAALQAMPGIGAVVFGGWSVAGTLGLAIGSVSPLSFVGLFVLGATWFPLGLTLLTAWILRS